MPTQQIQEIDNETAENLMSRYCQEINEKIQLNQSIDDLFEWGDNTQTLLAFKAPLAEFGVFDNLVGATKFSFSFGLEAETFDVSANNRPRFSLLIKVQNDEGSIQSKYYQHCGAVSSNEITLLYPERDLSSLNKLSVPKKLYDIWTEGWASPKTARLCSIDLTIGGGTVTVPIEKYIFNIWDAVNTLYSLDKPIEDLTAFICLVNHCRIKLDASGTGVVRDPGFDRIGLILGVAEQVDGGSNEYNFVSSLYDFSAPCPPTCP